MDEAIEPIPKDEEDPNLQPAMARLAGKPADFTRKLGRITLRDYQMGVAEAVLDSIRSEAGRSLVVMFPRQSGKNELQAHLEAYLLKLCSVGMGADIIKVSPTWKPQALTAMRRLERVLGVNVTARKEWVKESGYIYRVGRARISFLSGAPESNIVGATASLLLEVDEAQDVEIRKYDKDIAPMAAATNATRVFWGTAWTTSTLLARELRAAERQQRVDGIRRIFRLGADDVAREVPAYARFVKEQVEKLGRSHPLVRSQYFSEEVDSEGGMFPPARVSRMFEGRPRTPGDHPIALLIDVAGEDEGVLDESLQMSALRSPGRDSTALTVVDVDTGTLGHKHLRRPTYRVLERRLWTGIKHTLLYAELCAIAERCRANKLVVDATGVGAGLASFLERALPGRLIPFTFSAASKSQLGWDFLGIIDSGRWVEEGGSLSSEQYGDAGGVPVPQNPGTHHALTQSELRGLFRAQLDGCRYEILPGPEKRMRWGVPEGTRTLQGDLLHDDLVFSAALSAVLDGLDWSTGGATLIVPGRDPLAEMDKGR